MKRLEVSLMVCPECSAVSKLDVTGQLIRGYCQGPTAERHRRRRMAPRVFREVRGQR